MHAPGCGTLSGPTSSIMLHVRALVVMSGAAICPQASAAPPDDVAEAGGPRFAVLEVKPLMASLDMKETVMETLLSHLEVRPCVRWLCLHP